MANIRLRALTQEDIKTTIRWNNKDDIKFFYAGHPFPVNIEMETEWYKKILTSNFPTTVFGIELIEGGELIGLSFLKNIDLINRKAEFAIFIGSDSERGKGYSHEATILTLNFAFNDLGINRVYLFVMNNNTPAIKLYKKAGFSEEGHLIKSVFKNGNFYDEIVMGILKEKFDLK